MERNEPDQRAQAIFVLALLLVLVSSWVGGVRDVTQESLSPRLACWIGPNGTVALPASVVPECPLQAYDRVDEVRLAGASHRVRSRDGLVAFISNEMASLDLGIERRGRRVWVKVPILQEDRGASPMGTTTRIALPNSLYGDA
jgi:hypothetical protein